MNAPLRFSTPARQRDPQTIEVDLCGETIHVNRPKDATLYFAQQVLADTVADGDRAGAVLQFIEGTLGTIDRKRFFDRVIDYRDPVDMGASLAMIQGLIERWSSWESAPADPLVVTSDYTPPTGQDIPVVQDALDLEITAHPPKDIVRLIASASLATGATPGQQAWAIGLFLDAALDPGDAVLVSRRMRDQDDGLDLEHVAEIVSQLIKRWDSNRAERRAAANTNA